MHVSDESELDGPPCPDTLILGDCLEVMRRIPDGGVTALITDPPYGIGLDEWDTPVDLPAFMAEAWRVTRDYLSFFGQMPSIANWHNAAVKQGFRFVEDIAWVKRLVVPAGPRLGRSKESIYIYARRPGVRYHTVKGPFEDVKLPGVQVDTMTLEGIDRHIKDLRSKLEGKGGSIIRRPLDASHAVYSRLNNSTGDRSPAETGFTNVWSFLPPNYAKKTGPNPHPTAKPLPIMERLVEMLAPPGGVVLDPYAGSLTTAVACTGAGRRYLCIEQGEVYFEGGVARVRARELEMAAALPLGHSEVPHAG